MAAMIQNDEAKAWMQPIMDYRDKYLAIEDRHLRDFRRMNGRLILMNDRLVHGPYTQERRAELLRELLKTQTVVQKAMPRGSGPELTLIGMDELEEIRRIWVSEKGEIEDWVPLLYEEATGQPYAGKDLDITPLDASDLTLLREVAAEWAEENLPTDDPASRSQRADELYKLTRTLLGASFRGLQSRSRSGQLDELQSVLTDFAFLDESDALAFAKAHLKDQRAEEPIAIYDVDVNGSSRKGTPTINDPLLS